MTAVSIQSNKVVSNEFKNNLTLLEPSYRKKTNRLSGSPNIYSGMGCSGVIAVLPYHALSVRL